MINMDDLTFSYLLRLAKKLDIKVVQRYTDKNGFLLPSNIPSASNTQKRKIIMNMNWSNPVELPLILAHEEAHILNGDSGICYYTSISKMKTEASANKLAISILMDYYFDEMDPQEINILSFMDCYAIPSYYYDFISEKLENKFTYFVD